jgi:hypothetical protein
MKAVSTLDTVSEKTYQLFDQRTRQGKHFADQAVNYAIEHPNSSVKNILNYIISRAQVNDVDSIKNIDITLREMAESATKGEKIGQCVFCKKQIRHGVRFSMTADGASLNTGENGDLVSIDKCWHNLTYLIQASKSTDFNMDELTLEKKTYEREKLDKVMVPIEQLSNKILRQLEKNADFKRYGLNLESEIAASVADDIQKQILGGDISGLLRHADAARFKDTIKWAMNHKNAYDPQVLEAITLIEHRPDAITDEHLVTLFLYEFQERRLKLEGELSGIKDDILYLAEKGALKLTTKLPSIKVFPRARQKHKTLADILDNNGKPIDSVTKAEATAVRLAVPRLREKRTDHNRKVLDDYCKPFEWNLALNKLYETFSEQRQKYKEALENDEKNPETIWKKPTYLALKDFFEKMEAARAVKDMSFREVFLNYVFMQNANETAELLFVEGQKLRAGVEPRKEYKPFFANYSKNQEEMIKFAKTVEGIPIDRTSYEELRKHGAGLGDVNNVKKTLEFIKYGIIPQKPSKKETIETLEQALRAFEPSSETTEQANYLALISKSKYAPEMKHKNGKREYQIIPKNILNFEGKTHFTKEQQQTIKYAHQFTKGIFPKNYPTPEEMDAQYEKIKKFLETHTVLDGSPFSQYQKYTSHRIDAQKVHEKRDTINAIGEPEALSGITSETARKVRALINYDNPKDKQLYEHAKKTNKQQMEEWLADSSVRVTQSWLDNLEQWYSHIK